VIRVPAIWSFARRPTTGAGVAGLLAATMLAMGAGAVIISWTRALQPGLWILRIGAIITIGVVAIEGLRIWRRSRSPNSS
jgi:hypothetical protein